MSWGELFDEEVDDFVDPRGLVDYFDLYTSSEEEEEGEEEGDEYSYSDYFGEREEEEEEFHELAVLSWDHHLLEAEA